MNSPPPPSTEKKNFNYFQSRIVLSFWWWFRSFRLVRCGHRPHVRVIYTTSTDEQISYNRTIFNKKTFSPGFIVYGVQLWSPVARLFHGYLVVFINVWEMLKHPRTLYIRFECICPNNHDTWVEKRLFFLPLKMCIKIVCETYIYGVQFYSTDKNKMY